MAMEESPVDLGFIEEAEPDQLQSHFFPSKVKTFFIHDDFH